MRLYGGFLLGLPRYLERTLTLAEARQIVRSRIEQREENFLRTIDRGVFGNPGSPYRRLFEIARCSRNDIEQAIRADGVEPALEELKNAGVYITFEEFKGRRPIVREGEVIEVAPGAFDNPSRGGSYHVATGGSTGAGRRVNVDLDFLADRAPGVMIADDAHGILNLPRLLWFAPPPGNGLSSILYRTATGGLPEKWYSPVTKRFRSSLRFDLATWGIVTAGRLTGSPIPRPVRLGVDRAHVIAQWASEKVREQGGCLVSSHVSNALRVALAAQEHGIDLTGATISGGGEPPTPAKVRAIKRTGARFLSNYWFAEAGPIGFSCTRPADENDQHFQSEHLAIVQRSRRVPRTDVDVDAFLLTTLLPTAPKLLLNVETDDYGLIDSRACGCPLEACGFTRHLRHIRSFSKLTGEGVTLIGSEMVTILEEVLPTRFGGSPLDYQLREEEDEAGFTRLCLSVSPSVTIDDESEVVATVLEALSETSVAADMAGAIWRNAQTLRIQRAEPTLTARGKQIPLIPGHRSETSARRTKR